MIGEIDIFGVFVPAPLVLMLLIAYLINIVVRAVLERVGFYRLVWHRSIFDLGIYVFVFAAVVIVSPPSRGYQREKPALGRANPAHPDRRRRGCRRAGASSTTTCSPTRDGHVRADVIQVAPDVASSRRCRSPTKEVSKRGRRS